MRLPSEPSFNAEEQETAQSSWWLLPLSRQIIRHGYGSAWVINIC